MQPGGDLVCHVGIHVGSGNAGMAKQILDYADILAILRRKNGAEYAGLLIC